MVKETELKTALRGSTLGDFLISNPNCRIVINASRPIKKWEIGDVRIIGGRTKVKRQRMSDGCYVTYRGRLMHDWVELDDTTQSMIPNPVPPKPRFSRGQRVIILLLDDQHEAITGSSILLEYGWYTSVTPLGKKEAILLPEQLLINYYDRDWWEERPSSRPEGSHWLRKSEYKRKCERLETVQSKWEAEKTVRDATRKEQE